MTPVANPYAHAIRITLLLSAASLLAIGVGLARPAAGGLSPFLLAGGPLLIVTLMFALILWAAGALMRRQIRRLLDGGFLVHWTYGDVEWRAFTESEWQLARRKALRLPLTVVGIMAVVGALVSFLADGLSLVTAVLFGAAAGVPLGLLVAALAWLFAASTHNRRQAGPGEVYIGPRGVFQDGYYTGWSSLSLKGVTIEKGEPSVLKFRIEGSRASFDARVAIPRGKEHEAETLVAQLSETPSPTDPRLEAWLGEVLGRLEPEKIRFGPGEKLVDVVQRTFTEEEQRVQSAETDAGLRSEKLRVLGQLKKKFT